MGNTHSDDDSKKLVGRSEIYASDEKKALDIRTHSAPNGINKKKEEISCEAVSSEKEDDANKKGETSEGVSSETMKNHETKPAKDPERSSGDDVGDKNSAVTPAPTSTIKKSPSLLDLVVQQIFPKSDDNGDNKPSVPQQQKPRPPKHMLWACQTPEQHYECIRQACTIAKELSGAEGLRALGFEYRMVHHPDTCTCTNIIMDDEEEPPPKEADTNSNNLHHAAPKREMSDLNDDDDDLAPDGEDEETNNSNHLIQSEPQQQQQQQQQREVSDLNDNSDDCFELDGEGGYNEVGVDMSETFMVPIGIPLVKSMTNLMEGIEDDDDDENIGASPIPTATGGDGAEPVSSSSPSMSRIASNVSLFSLATHQSTASSNISSNGDEEYDRRPSSNEVNNWPPEQQEQKQHVPRSISCNSNNQNKNDESEQTITCCALRLHHVPSGMTLVTNHNHQSFVAHGQMYDEVARLCMEYAQDVMMQEGKLQWQTICDERQIGALVSSSSSSDDQPEVVQTTSDSGNSDDNEAPSPREQQRRRNVLLVVTGKGLVRAGIFSRRLLITMGIEPATALPLVREAVRRDMDIVLLDPNAQGDRRGMEVAEASFNKLFLEEPQHQQQDIYMLAHSMAGSQLVRYLLKVLPTTESNGKPSSATVSDDDDDDNAQTTNAAVSFFERIKAVSFTDSNHNINWTKRNPALTDFLIGPACLYIKSHKVHDDAKALGELHHDCHFWKHRFGTIRTLWAGTREHALTNFTARMQIWDHFDSFLFGMVEKKKQ